MSNSSIETDYLPAVYLRFYEKAVGGGYKESFSAFDQTSVLLILLLFANITIFFKSRKEASNDTKVNIKSTITNFITEPNNQEIYEIKDGSTLYNIDVNKVFEKLLRKYQILQGDSKLLLKKNIESYIEKGLNIKEAIYLLAKKEGITIHENESEHLQDPPTSVSTRTSSSSHLDLSAASISRDKTGTIKIRCLKCGIPNNENAKFCNQCGNSFFTSKN